MLLVYGINLFNNGLVQNQWQTISWTSDTYVSADLNELKFLY